MCTNIKGTTAAKAKCKVRSVIVDADVDPVDADGIDFLHPGDCLKASLQRAPHLAVYSEMSLCQHACRPALVHSCRIQRAQARASLALARKVCILNAEQAQDL